VHGSIGWGLSAQYSANIYVDSTNFVGARAVGVNIFSSNNVTLSNSVVGDVQRRDELTM
jgi:post-segregation antitoxin (ccd killing protein)